MVHFGSFATSAANATFLGCAASCPSLWESDEIATGLLGAKPENQV
jgi:hypothetical protein